MSESLFDIFGDHLTRQAVKNVARQPLHNIENMGKTVSTGPVKPNEPMKKAGETKKSFLCNKGATLTVPSTPTQRVLSPKNRNLMSAQKVICPEIIYREVENDEGFIEELQFTKPTYKFDNFHTDVLDYLNFPEDKHVDQPLPSTPPPRVKCTSSFDSSYGDDFFSDGSFDSIHYEEEDNFPDLY